MNIKVLRFVWLGLCIIGISACGQNESPIDKRAVPADTEEIIFEGDELPDNFAELSQEEQNQIVEASAEAVLPDDQKSLNLSYYWRIGRTAFYTNGRCTWWYNPWGNGHYCR